MSKISIFRYFNKVIANQEFKVITETIKGDRFKNEIIELRKVYDSGDENAYSKQKKKLLAFTPSGLFEGGRKSNYLKTYSGIIVLDIDKSGDQTEKFRTLINNCKYTYCCFLSPSGQGLKVLVRVQTSPDQHLNQFNQIKKHYEKLIGFKIDPSGKDLTRLCFFSYDPEIFYNDKSKPFSFKEKLSGKSYHKAKSFENVSRITNKSSKYENGNRNNYIYQFACNCNRTGIEKSETIKYVKEKFDLDINEAAKTIDSAYSNNGHEFAKERLRNVNQTSIKQQASFKPTSNKFAITENYLDEHYTIRYNVVACKFEYKAKDARKFKDLNEYTLFIKLQKDNIQISLNHLIALLKSDYVKHYNPFVDYFESLPKWDGITDHIGLLSKHLITPDPERLQKQFKKWLVRVVKSAVNDRYFNKQAFILVSNTQNNGKSTFCRYLCPPKLKDYIVENIGTDKDSLIALTENLFINLDELSSAQKNDINAFKSMFSKDKVKARLAYDKRASVHVRRASFSGSTDRWEFLTDENGSVRWLCFDITRIDWAYNKTVNMDLVYAQAIQLLKDPKFNCELSYEEMKENERINKKYQVSTIERDLIQKHFILSIKEEGVFMTASEITEELRRITSYKIDVSSVQIGKELKFLGFERKNVFKGMYSKYGYFVKKVKMKS